jgi:uncharacterized membrane protein
MAQATHGFWSDFRKFFFRGLAILLPSMVTLALVYWAGSFLWEKVANPINKGVRSAFLAAAPEIVGESGMPGWYVVTEDQVAEVMRTARPRPANEAIALKVIRREQFRGWWEARWYLQAIGFVVAVVSVYLAGVALGNLIGRRVYARVEALAVRVPIIKQVYPSVKQVTDFVLGQGEQKSKLPAGRTVMVEYPRKGIWTLGLMTRESPRSVNERVGRACVAIFIPTTPTPFTGFTINVPADEVFEVAMTIDELIKFVVSAGVLISDGQVTGVMPEIDSGQVPEGWRAASRGGPPRVEGTALPGPDAAG